MSNITFDAEGKTKTVKEDIEWLRIWCEETNETKLPRVALIGDSITEGYFRLVQKALQGIALVDYLATSYSINSAIYNTMVKSFADDSAYAVVHFNYGLHGYNVDEKTYEARCKALLEYISQKSKTIVATSTTVLENDLKTESAHWLEKVRLRNESLVKIATESALTVDDLNALSQGLLGENRMPDGVHFSEKGYIALAESVVKSIQKVL